MPDAAGPAICFKHKTCCIRCQHCTTKPGLGPQSSSVQSGQADCAPQAAGHRYLTGSRVLRVALQLRISRQAMLSGAYLHITSHKDDQMSTRWTTTCSMAPLHMGRVSYYLFLLARACIHGRCDAHVQDDKDETGQSGITTHIGVTSLSYSHVPTLHSATASTHVRRVPLQLLVNSKCSCPHCMHYVLQDLCPADSASNVTSKGAPEEMVRQPVRTELWVSL
jgi:hypothetical protein